MTMDELEAKIADMAIPKPPRTASDDLKAKWLSLELLKEICLELKAMNSKEEGTHGNRN